MEIRGEKEVDYINKLYFDFENQKLRERVQDKIENRDYTKREIALLTLKETKNEVLRTNRSYTKSELAEFLNRSTSTYAHEFLKKLEEHDVLKHTGKRKTGSNPVDTWKLDKGKLLVEYAESEYFQKRKDLDAAALDHIGEAFKFN
jgi:hypothetical protein